MMGYVSYYANGIAGIGVLAISVILTAMRVFDGVTDPIIGYIIDKTNSRFGKFRPYILSGWFILAIASYLLYTFCDLVPGFLRIPFFILVYSLYIIGYTLQTAVVKSGQSVITNDVGQRPMITFFDSTFIMLAHGLTAFYVSVYLIGKYGSFSNKALFREFVISVIILSFICTVMAIVGIWQKDKSEVYIKLEESGHRPDIKFRDYISILRHNRPIRMLVMAAASNKFAAMVYSNSTVLVMFFGIMIGNYAIAGIIGLIVGLPTLLIISLGIRMAKKMGQKKVFIISTWACFIFQGIMMLMMIFCDMRMVSLTSFNLISLGFIALFAILNGTKSISNNMIVPMIADCTDYEYSMSGRFVPGLMGALFSFVDKSFSALGTGVVGLVLTFAGYSKVLPAVNDELSPTLKVLTIVFYCALPMASWLFTIFIMKYYKLDRKAIERLYEAESSEEVVKK